MNHDCFFDGQGVCYEDEVEGKVYILNPNIMRELTLYGYATKEDVLVTVFRELDGALHSNEEDLRTRIDYLEKANELAEKTKEPAVLPVQTA